MKTVSCLFFAALLGSIAVPVSAATIDYTFEGYDSGNTRGGFSVSGQPGAYTLSGFYGKIGGVSYGVTTVDLRQVVNTGIYTLAGAVNGSGSPQAGTNDFLVQTGFVPHIGPSLNRIDYTTGSSSSAGNEYALEFNGRAGSDYRPASYVYDFYSTDGITGGSFTVLDNYGAYSITDFSGMVGGVSYSEDMVKLTSERNGSFFLSTNNTDYVGVGYNNFAGADFIPGENFVSGGFQYGRANDSLAELSDTSYYLRSTIPYVSQSVSAVPESATWIMMILGVGAIGVMMRWRTKVSTTVKFA